MPLAPRRAAPARESPPAWRCKSVLKDPHTQFIRGEFNSRDTSRKHTIARVQRSTTKRGPLDGLLVLDLTRAVAGPFCTMLLGDLGARVIKIEEPDGGDETRHWGQASEGGESAYFLALNRNKESISLHVKHPSGLPALHKLARKADVLVQNFRPGVVERL